MTWGESRLDRSPVDLGGARIEKQEDHSPCTRAMKPSVTSIRDPATFSLFCGWQGARAYPSRLRTDLADYAPDWSPVNRQARKEGAETFTVAASPSLKIEPTLRALNSAERTTTTPPVTSPTPFVQHER